MIKHSCDKCGRVVVTDDLRVVGIFLGYGRRADLCKDCFEPHYELLKQADILPPVLRAKTEGLNNS